MDIKKLNEELDEILDEPIDDEYEQIRHVLNAYADSENAFVDGYVTLEDLKQFDADNWLLDWSDEAIIDCAKEEGYEVQGNKILDPSF